MQQACTSCDARQLRRRLALMDHAVGVVPLVDHPWRASSLELVDARKLGVALQFERRLSVHPLLRVDVPVSSGTAKLKNSSVQQESGNSRG